MFSAVGEVTATVFSFHSSSADCGHTGRFQKGRGLQKWPGRR